MIDFYKPLGTITFTFTTSASEVRYFDWNDQFSMYW